ncbi:hypothetical protein PAJ63_08420 [Campylobacter coli]|uniref:hypothetical protein n=1 Tax=Campylobacter coli TaxID=195 RepID=UPI001F3C7E1F|nr:hypothetical protein [Campylobacter coli]MDN2805689.1 hypothetical protein [Campylobacter coli]
MECKSKMKKITIVAYAICFLSGLWFLFSAIKEHFGILSFILGIALIYFGVINIKRILNDSNENKERERQVALKLGSLEVLNLVNYDNNPQRIRNQIAIPSSYTKILKGDNFKECYQVPNHEVENENIRSYQVKCH